MANCVVFDGFFLTGLGTPFYRAGSPSASYFMYFYTRGCAFLIWGIQFQLCTYNDVLLNCSSIIFILNPPFEARSLNYMQFQEICSYYTTIWKNQVSSPVNGTKKSQPLMGWLFVSDGAEHGSLSAAAAPLVVICDVIIPAGFDHGSQGGAKLHLGWVGVVNGIGNSAIDIFDAPPLHKMDGIAAF